MELRDSVLYTPIKLMAEVSGGDGGIMSLDKVGSGVKVEPRAQSDCGHSLQYLLRAVRSHLFVAAHYRTGFHIFSLQSHHKSSSGQNYALISEPVLPGEREMFWFSFSNLQTRFTSLWLKRGRPFCC